MHLQALEACGSWLGGVQVMMFAWTIYEDLSNYDTNGAWPTLIDDYVCSARRKHAAPEVRGSLLSPTSLNQENLLPVSIPAHVGSKRQHTDIAEQANELAEQLSDMHTNESGPASRADSQAQPTAGSSGAGAAAAPHAPNLPLFKAKRYKHVPPSGDYDSPRVPFGALRHMPGAGSRQKLRSANIAKRNYVVTHWVLLAVFNTMMQSMQVLSVAFLQVSRRHLQRTAYNIFHATCPCSALCHKHNCPG